LYVSPENVILVSYMQRLITDHRTKGAAEMGQVSDEHEEQKMDLEKILAKYSSMEVPSEQSSPFNQCESTPRAQLARQPARGQDRSALDDRTRRRTGSERDPPEEKGRGATVGSVSGSSKPHGLGIDPEVDAKLVEAAEESIQDCVSHSKGMVDAAFVVLPDGVTCLGASARSSIDGDIASVFIEEHLGSFAAYDDALQIGEVTELRITGDKGTILLMANDGFKAMALLSDKSHFPLARIQIMRTLSGIAGLMAGGS
jgi:predicted regulator of Ras-like GTPase activity (Roadblock/LC7/MglB family)